MTAESGPITSDVEPVAAPDVADGSARPGAFDLWFEAEGGLRMSSGDGPTFPVPASAVPSGWIGTTGPGFDPTTWPRGTATGLPMFHAITLLLPEDFQRRGPHYPAVAFFQGEGQFAASRTAADADDPFEVDLARSTPHAQLRRREDVIDGQFALVWLTQEEFDAGPSAPPPDPRRPGEHVATDEGPNAWDTLEPTRTVWLRERPDPNAGLPPVDAFGADGSPGYVSPFDEQFAVLPWAQDLPTSHLGGTAFPVQGLAEGFTAYYLELEELPGLNFGSGIAQIDLESDAFDWAC
ncbi:hypothetical protein [Cellulomonas sp. URHD0024]|uniref:hypothetical protein n=1 Tax=Cellulomonas sp. URHD0024 TaxID=1302620 RepID=UPI000404EBA9|nr:hypothetical protein [Cellulomonas sp. URHD0024]